MHSESLHQRWGGLNRRTVTLLDVGVKVEDRSPFTALSETIPYYSLARDVTEAVNRPSRRWLYGSGIFAFFTAIAIASPETEAYAIPLWAAVSVALAARWLLFPQPVKGYAPVFLHAKRPSRYEVDAFLKAMDQARKSALASMPMSTAKDDVTYSLARLAHLRDEGVISNEEFARLKAKAIADETEQGPDEAPGMYL